MNVPISDCEVRDPRIRRTRQLLQSALSGLLASKPFEEISVQDITDAATVNRATFYDHYADKFALLDAMVAGGFHRLLNERNIQFDGTCPSAASAIIQAACDYLTELHDGHNNCAGQSGFERLIDSSVTNAISLSLLRGAKNMRAARPDDQIPPEIILTSISWAIYGAVKQWFSTPNRWPIETAVPQIMKIILPLFAAADSTRVLHSEVNSLSQR